MPTYPKFLPNGARAEWTRVAHRLYSLGLLTCLDRAALAAYCYNYDLWMTALEALKSEDMVVELDPVRTIGVYHTDLAITDYTVLIDDLALLLEGGRSDSEDGEQGLHGSLHCISPCNESV